jgi:hypothetical protein
MNMSIYVSESLNKQLINTVQDAVRNAVTMCASHYKFDAEEAVRLLNLIEMKVQRTKKAEKKAPKEEKEKALKPAFPLPFNGEFNNEYCYGLRQNNGLYTQCQTTRKGEKSFCKSCQKQADKNENGKPDYGTIQDRLACGIMEYKDPSGRSPTAYVKVMKKYKITQERAQEEAGKFNMTINELHFASTEAKKGRPKTEKKPKEVKEGKKGRPKKSKKVIEVEGESEDLFASLIANAADESQDAEEEEIVLKPKKADEEAKAAKKKADEEAKAAKKKADEEAKLAKKQAEEEAKAAKKKAEEEAKAAKKKAEEEAKAAKKKADEEAKAAKKKADEELKALKESKKKSSSEEKKASKKEEEEKPDVVKRIEYEGKKYLKSKNTGVIYNMDQDVVGKWNEATNKIDFDEPESEEDEDEYDE